MCFQKATEFESDSPIKSMDRDLYLAASTGDSDFIKRLITDETGYCLTQVTPQRNSLLHIAITSQQTELVRTLIRRLCPCLLPHQNSHGDTPLHVAAKMGCLEIVRLLVDDGVPAHRAREMSNYYDPSPDDLSLLRKVNGCGDSPLHLAVRSGHIDVVELLVKADSQLMYIDNKVGESPVFMAVEAGFFDIARCMILQMSSSPSSPHYKGANGLTALHAALIRTHHGRALESHVPDLSLENIRRIMRDGLLSLYDGLAGRFQSCQIDIIKVLVNKWPLIVTEADEYGRTPLHYAAHLGHLEATKHLLEMNCSVAYIPNKEGMCAFHVAAKQGHVKIMDELIDHCPDVHELHDEKGRTALHVAVVSGRTRVVKYILGNKKFQELINIPDEEGNTPLHLAANCGKDEILMTLTYDRRVDKKAVNKQHCKAIDILHYNPSLGELVKTRIMKKMERAGSRQSLKLVIRDEADTRRYDPYSENNDVKAGDLSGSNSFSERDVLLRLYSDRSSLERSTSGMTSLSDNSFRSIRLKGISGTHLLVATLIATVTFTAGLAVPGGYKDRGSGSDDPGSDDGTAALVSRAAFRIFLIANALAFYCSTLSVFLHFLTSVEHNFHLLLRFTKFAAVLTYISILALMIAFTSGIRAILPGWDAFSTATVAIGCCFVVVCLFGFI
ncbi:ankyrin-1 isoform X2 [Eucalyptus grandis]|uniref:ankyrin-1 isoform X2 n=1 Tax=Eucalyptus grandis TaxID=71139 RepID=UPI00192ED267|nr:ankyrin-1 isoform X2 [Eucalyptus grandis]